MHHFSYVVIDKEVDQKVYKVKALMSTWNLANFQKATLFELKSLWYAGNSGHLPFLHYMIWSKQVL